MGFRRGLALLVAATFFMEIVDATIIAPAAPLMAADLGVSSVDVNVTITAYVLTLGVLIPISGWLTDRFGARRVFATALILFTLSSLACALAPNLVLLTTARVVQGVGGAMMVPVGRLVVLRATPKKDLVKAVAYLTWPALLAPVVAPVVGGLLAQYASWRWIFVINLPLGIAALAVAWAIVPDLRAERPAPFDRVGFGWVAVGTAALVVALEGLGSGFGPATAVALVVAVVGLGWAIRHLLRAPNPLLDLRILRITTYRITAATGSVYRGVITAIPFVLPLLFQLGFGWTPARAGLVVIALFVGNVGIKPATTPLMRRFGIRTVLLASILVGAACLVGLAFVRADTPLPVLLALLLVSGISRSTGFTAYNSVAFADVDEPLMNHANTLLSTLQELGAGLGVAIGALLIRAGGLVATDAPGPFRVALALLAVLLAIPLVAAIRLPHNAGNAVTGRVSRRG
ncbi:MULTISPECIES: MFS transporter [unclassified Amycolatopsis]|uniref:MFS transporter n=1 Tax=unclassified Amycolatopsis TaxID=2618356 RepID=UPI0034547D83